MAKERTLEEIRTLISQFKTHLAQYKEENRNLRELLQQTQEAHEQEISELKHEHIRQQLKLRARIHALERENTKLRMGHTTSVEQSAVSDAIIAPLTAQDTQEIQETLEPNSKAKWNFVFDQEKESSS